MARAHTLVAKQHDELLGVQHNIQFTEQMAHQYIKKLS